MPVRSHTTVSLSMKDERPDPIVSNASLLSNKMIQIN